METPSSSSASSEGDSIKIFLRVRPPDQSISENDFAPRVLDVNTEDNAVILRTKPEAKVFTYDNVADADISQEAVFTIVGKKIIESCVTGYNGTIFAYGQTGSGKTFTMLGPSENSESFQHELRGVIPRSFEYLFSLVAHQQELHGSKKQFLCRCSFLEIYQEQIFDLLDPTSQGLHLRENMNKGVFVDGLIEQVVCNPRDAYQVLIMGWLNRRVAATSMNRESSRSHAVFTVTIESKEDVGGIQNIRASQLNLVDLAGSERQRDTNTGGTRLKEAGSINKSLSVLGNVIMSLVDISHGKKRHIPYRDSKLTFLLRDSLGGNTKTRMIACVHPDAKCFGETLSTLNFARNAKLIKNKAVVNEDFHGNNQKLQMEIRRLREMLEALQQCPSDQSTLLAKGPTSQAQEPNLNSESVWKGYFMEAMYFRDVAENERKALQDVVNHLQQLCLKKDKYIQSAKMIIKLRENSIQSLKQNSEMDKESAVKALQEELKIVREQCENSPLLAKYSGENKHLRNELKMLRERVSLDEVHGDRAHTDRLEKVFKELKMLKDLNCSKGPEGPGGSPTTIVRSSPVKSPMVSAVVLERHKKEVREHQQQVETLKKQLLDVSKVAENRQMELEVELVSSRKMISELERVLEAHQLKARIECNALKDLHCQTLKVMTTPKMSPSPSTPSLPAASPALNTPGTRGATEDQASAPGEDLAREAHDALMEEIRTLQMQNGASKECIDEYEAETLRLKQQVEKLEMYNKQLNGVLERERSECNARMSDYTSAVTTLKEEIETVRNDLTLLNDENTDLHLVLKSTDKQLKEEKENHKAIKQTLMQETQAMEAKLTAIKLEMENTTRDYEEALKELISVREEHELSQVTNNFLNGQVQELTQALGQESRTRKSLEEKMQTMEQAGEVQNFNAVRQQLESSLAQTQAQLDAAMLDQERKEADLARQAEQIMEDKEAISNLMHMLQELKAKLSVSDAQTATARVELETVSQELRELKKDHEMATSELACLAQDRAEDKEYFQRLLMEKDFKIDNLQADQDSFNAHLLRQEEIITSLQGQLNTKEKLCKEYEATTLELKNKVASTEESYHEVMSQYQQSLSEASHQQDLFKKVQELQDKNRELEALHINYQKLNSMFKEYEQDRIEKNEENELLKGQVSELEEAKARLVVSLTQAEEKHCSTMTRLACQAEREKSLEASLRAKEEELQSERNKARAVSEEEIQSLEWEKEFYMQEVNRLQSLLESHHQEKSELHSQVETLVEEKAKMAAELAVEQDRNAELMEESSQLMGHSNTKQKIRLMHKKNLEYNDLSKKYRELQERYEKVLRDTGRSSMPHSTSLVGSSPKNSSATVGLRDVTSFN